MGKVKTVDFFVGKKGSAGLNKKASYSVEEIRRVLPVVIEAFAPRHKAVGYREVFEFVE